jgi:hypothetical protein
MSDDRKVTVTINPTGQVTDIAVGGTGIAHAIRSDAVDLAIGGLVDLPRLTITLIPDEIVMKGATA